MMGQLPAGQNALFYEFCIERHVPSKAISCVRLIPSSI